MDTNEDDMADESSVAAVENILTLEPVDVCDQDENVGVVHQNYMELLDHQRSADHMMEELVLRNKGQNWKLLHNRMDLGDKVVVADAH